MGYCPGAGQSDVVRGQMRYLSPSTSTIAALSRFASSRALAGLLHMVGAGGFATATGSGRASTAGMADKMAKRGTKENFMSMR